MTPDLSFLSSSNGGFYAKGAFGGTDNYYKVSALNGLARDTLVDKENLNPISKDSACKLFGEGNIFTILKNWAFIYQEYEKSLLAICSAIGSNVEKVFCERISILDLSNSGIKILPPQIHLFKQLSELNLRGNDLDSLPQELEDLPLTNIDLTGNLRLMSNMPGWVYARDFVILPDGTKLEKDNLRPSSLMGRIV